MVEHKGYIPSRGDLTWLAFSPQAGSEQSGRRPALVISPAQYNAKVGLAIFCPITSQVKGYPFEVLIPEDCPTQGVILSDHVKSLDWRARDAVFICRLPETVVHEVIDKLNTLIRIE